VTFKVPLGIPSVAPSARILMKRRTQGLQSGHDDHEDPDETLDLNPHNTELMLFIDIEMFKELTGSATDPMRAFHMYGGATWDKAAFEAFPHDALEDLTALAAQMSKREFFDFCLGLIERGPGSAA
jgi:hypothetical protein